MTGEKNHQYGLKGEKNASWGGKMRKRTQYGYIQVRVLDHPFATSHGWVLEHRIVAEKYLLNELNSVEIDGKRYLSPDYVVHHINFDRRDNSIENLIVMTKEEHTSYHAKLNGSDRDEFGRFIKDTMPVKIKKVTETAIIPTKGSEGSAGYDLYVDSDKVVTIPPHKTVMLQTNIAFEIPRGYFGAVYARSGVSTKRGLRPATCVSVIDSDYRGSVGVPLHNDTDEDRIVLSYERVAQMVITPIPEVELVLVDELPDTDRGTGGFGSTGEI